MGYFFQKAVVVMECLYHLLSGLLQLPVYGITRFHPLSFADGSASSYF